MINIKKISRIAILLLTVSCSEQIDSINDNATNEYIPETYLEYSIKGLTLNNVEKWRSGKETNSGLKKMLDLSRAFNYNSTLMLADYNEFGNHMDEIKTDILRKCTMTGIGHDHLHILLIPLIRKINGIKELEDLEKANEIYTNIELNIELYDDDFKI